MIASIAILIYFLLRKSEKMRLYWLIFVSLILLGQWNWQSVVCIIINIVATFLIGIKIGNAQTKRTRYFLATFGILTQVATLIFIKLISFSSSSSQYETTLIVSTIYIGSSFYILQNISYLVEIYRNNISAESSLLYYFTYSIYFPKLLLGPIERYDKFSNELKTWKSPIQPSRSLYLISMGLFKKLVISARVMGFYHEMQASYVKGQPLLVFASTAFLGLIVLYCDFSAYMNIGQGISLAFGIELTENFNCPYYAKNPVEYWQRWHITLTNWMRDYVYYPIMLASKNIYIAIFITFGAVGLWHGFKKELFLWGIAWGFFQIIYILTRNKFKLIKRIPIQLQNFIGIILTISTAAFIGLYTYHTIFFKRELVNVHSWVDSRGLSLYASNYYLFIFIGLMVTLETLNNKNKSNSFYINSSFLLIFLTSVFMTSSSYLFYYMRL